PMLSETLSYPRYLSRARPGDTEASAPPVESLSCANACLGSLSAALSGSRRQDNRSTRTVLVERMQRRACGVPVAMVTISEPRPGAVMTHELALPSSRRAVTTSLLSVFFTR